MSQVTQPVSHVQPVPKPSSHGLHESSHATPARAASDMRAARSPQPVAAVQNQEYMMDNGTVSDCLSILSCGNLLVVLNLDQSKLMNHLPSSINPN